MRAAAALLLLCAAQTARGETIVDDGGSRWRIDLPAGFSAAAPADLDEGVMLARFEGPAGRRIVVARLRLDTEGLEADERAWYAGLEEGVKVQTKGYRRLAATRRKLGRARVPALDLWYRAGDAVRGSRFVLFKSYAVVLSVHAPRARRVDAALRRALESFQPG